MKIFFRAILCLVLLVGSVNHSQAQNCSASGVGITNPDSVINPTVMPLQSVGQPFTDPAFGTTLERITGRSASGGFGTHIYSQLQAFSSDNVFVLLIEDDAYVVRRVSNLALMPVNLSNINAPRWHPTQAHTIVHFDTNEDTVIRLQFTNVDTGNTTTEFTFPAQYQRIRGNQSFDEISEDGRWISGMASLSNGGQGIFALDMQNDTLASQMTLNGLYTSVCQPDPVWGQVEPDWIGVSPLGNYLVVQWARDGTTRCSGMETFQIQTGAFAGRVTDSHQHGDLGILPDGQTEFFMTYEMGHPSGNMYTGYRELPGTSTVAAPVYLQPVGWDTGGHISCRGPNGVCLITSAYDPSNGWGPREGELFLQYTDGSVVRLAHHRSTSCGYWVQPRASISRDGCLMIFASDWREFSANDSCGTVELGSGDTYLIDLRGDTGGNQAPTANAGADQEVDEGAIVNLTGSGNDPENQTITYEWTQTTGPDVTLSNPNSASTSFEAPQVDANTTLTFRLTVTDTEGLAGSDFVTVRVRDTNVIVLFFDDFEDGDITDWQIVNGKWRTVDGDLRGSSRKKAVILAPFDGCDLCALQTTFRLMTASAQLSVFGWYQDEWNNVEFVMKDNNDRATLKEKIGGSIVAQSSVSLPITDNVDYEIEMRYDGSDFTVFVNSQLLTTLASAGSPFGRPAFKVKSTTGQSASAQIEMIQIVE